MDKELLSKSQIHSDNLLKMVKALTNEKKQLENQIKQLQTKLEQQEFVIQENVLLKQQLKEKENNCNSLIKEVNELYQEKNILERQLSNNRSRIIVNNPENTKDQTTKNQDLFKEIQIIKEQNEQLLKENDKLKKEKEILFNEIALLEKRYTRVKTASNVSMQMSVHDLELSQYFVAQNDYEKSQIFLKQENDKIKLFEDFYIISVPLTSIKYENPEPMVLFKHPIQCENNLKSFFTALPMFSYPRGAKCQLSIQQKNDILRVLQEDTRYLDFAIQVFTPNKDSGNDIKNPFIMKTNPDQLLYAVILYSVDFIADKKLTDSGDLVKQKKLGNFNQNIYVTNVAYVILTYYPYHKLFFELISNIIRAMKIERLEQCKQIFEQENDLRDIDQFYFTNYENEIRKYLDSILLIQQQNISKPMILFGNTDKYIQNTSYDFGILTFEMAPCDLLIGWTAYNFVIVFASLICEQKVVITGPSRKQISYLMILLTLCIKPLKYYHPFVLDVPEKLMPLLDAPVPVFLGIPQQNIDLKHFDVVSVQICNQNIKIEKFETMNSTLLIELENKLKHVFQNKYSSHLQQIEHLLKVQNEFMNQLMINENKITDVFLEKVKASQLFSIRK